MRVISLSQLTHQVHSNDGNSRARKRPRKVKSLPRSRRVTSDLEIEGEIGLFRIFKEFF